MNQKTFEFASSAGTAQKILEVRSKWLKDIRQKWQKAVDILSPGKTEQQMNNLLVMMDNQHLINNSENVAWTDNFKKSSLTATPPFYNYLVIKELIGISPMLGPGGSFVYEEKGELKTRDWVAKTRKMKASWNFEDQGDLRDACGMSVQTEIAHILAQSVAQEVCQEIAINLRDNPGTEVVSKASDLLAAIEIASDSIASKTGHAANWIIVHEDEFRYIEDSSQFVGLDYTTSMHPVKKGRLSDKWDVYVFPGLKDFDMLMGFKGNEYQAGFFYGPYIVFNQSPASLMDHPESFCSKIGLMSRYAKCLVNKDYYAKIILTGKSQRNRIIVNGREVMVGDEVTYEDVMRLAYRDTYTMTYGRGPASKKEGILHSGESVSVKDGMVFSVALTNNA